MNYYPHRTLLYFPTTVLFVDDDPIFLSNIGFKMNKNIPIELCNKPRDALQLLKTAPRIDDVVQKAFAGFDYRSDLGFDSYLRENIKQIYKEIYNINRFSYISVLVIDYSMPNIDGAEFCKQIADIPVKKIMLTGEADHATAVKLFNDGLIDNFIVKDSPRMEEEIATAVGKAQRAYFECASTILFDHLTKVSPYFGDAIFEKHFHELLGQNEFSEYYIIDSSGSFLLLDFDGKATWLVVKSDKEIENYYDIAVDQEASKSTIELLKGKSVVPFFFTKSDFKLPASEWMPYLHESNKNNAIENYYYAVIKDSSLYSLEYEKIISHHDYLLKQI